MRKPKTAYELARSQVSTPLYVVKLFWCITRRYRSRFSRVLDLGAGDGRFALGGRYASYEGVEIDTTRRPLTELPQHATVRYQCAFKHDGRGYAACIGNPPYVRHHDLDATWRDSVAKRIGPEKEALWKRGASNAGYHYLGCAKTLALIGKAFAEAMLEMEKTKEQ